MENHLHFIAQAPELDKCVAGFKAYTARRIIDHLQRQQAERLLQRLHFAKAAHKRDREYQSGKRRTCRNDFERSDDAAESDYIHANPVKRGYVNLPQHWRYSSAANYEAWWG
ncbi:transposase [Methylomonas koyamae]|uniref:transposase n=1 Tax=Methylomonas koyamae TaxID=702114 RepID=UPI00210F4091|nr:transposase [Methylomonas koyamae]